MSPNLDFQRDLIALIPHMRAFARGLCGDPVVADDLAQEALLSAWRRQETFRRGTNMRGWVFMIVRNHFFSLKRRAWRLVALDPEVAERTLVCAPVAEDVVCLDEVRRALARLPEHQREALLLVGAGELSYQEAAELTGVHIGTVKSRVCRARHALMQMLWRQSVEQAPDAATLALDLMFDEMKRARAA